MTDEKFISAGWLIDGTGGPIKKNIFLSISHGKIAKVKEKVPNHLLPHETLDLSDSTILPCLVDCHVHLFMSGTQDPYMRTHQLNAGYDEIKDAISERINHQIAHGVLAVRDGGDAHAHALRYKETCFDFQKTPIFLKVAGKAWRSRGRYGKLIGRPPAGKDTLAESISKQKTNLDHVKIVNSGLNSLTTYGKQTSSQFDLPEMKTAVSKANSFNLKVMVHANGKHPVKTALDAGCHSIEHGFFMGKDNLKLMAERNIFWVPTAYTMKAYAQCLDPSGIKADIAKKNLDHQLQQISTAKTLGVPIALGTDAGSIGVHHGSAIIEEMKLMMDAGYSIQEAVKCAAFNGAMLLGVTPYGTLTKTAPATFIAVKGDPARLPKSLTDCRVYRNAQPI